MRFLPKSLLLCACWAAYFSPNCLAEPGTTVDAASINLAKQACDQGNRAKARGENKEALECFQKAARLNPQEGAYRKYLAEALLAAHAPNKALKEIDEAIRLSPKDGKAHISKGAILENLNQEEQAVAEYRRAIAMGHSGQAVFDYLYKIYMRRKNYTAALELLEIRTRENPNDARGYISRSMLQLTMNNSKGALESAKRAAQLAPFDYRPMELAGDAYLNLGQPSEAIKAFSKALDLEPYFTAIIYTKRARAYKLTGHEDLADKDLLKARE